MKRPSSDGTRFGTLAVHAGQEPEPMTGAIIPPIFQTSTYVQPDVAEPKQGFDYARVKNPTGEGLERKVATLEGGTHGIAFSSGLAAIEAVVKRLSAGDPSSTNAASTDPQPCPEIPTHSRPARLESLEACYSRSLSGTCRRVGGAWVTWIK